MPAVGHLRAIVRLLVVLSLTVLVYPPLILARLCDNRRKAALQEALFRTWAASVARTIGMHVKVVGQLPPMACLLVANHLGYIDIVLLATQVRCAFIAKKEISRWPGIGLFARSVNTIFVDRNRKRDLLRVIERMAAALAEGEKVLFFPEGTSSKGDRVLEFKSSLFEAAVRNPVPICCAALGYRAREGGPSAAEFASWYDDQTFLPHLYALLKIAEFEATVTFTSLEPQAHNRKQLAVDCWLEISKQRKSLPLAGPARCETRADQHEHA